MTNRQVAQKFAQGAIKGHSMNMFIENNTIYSYGYHFPMARRTGKMLRNGKEVVLVTTRTYSVSTSKHQAYTASELAYSGNYEIVHVHDVEHPEVDEMTERLNNAISKKLRARTEHMKEYWAKEASEIHHDREIVAVMFA